MHKAHHNFLKTPPPKKNSIENTGYPQSIVHGLRSDALAQEETSSLGYSLSEKIDVGLVSVVIPMYNREKTIGRCIDSALNQNYDNIEILVIDDMSTDNSVNVVKSINNNKIKLICADKKIYAQGARNIGIKNANGRWIAFLDSDDTFTKNSILSRLNVLETYPDVDLIYGNFFVNNVPFIFKNINNIGKKELKNYIFSELSLCAFSSIMIKKQCVEKIGFLDENYLAWQDDSLIVSCILNNFNLKHCGDIVASFSPFGSNNRISSTYSNRLQGISRIVATYKNEIIRTNGRYRLFLWNLRILLNFLETKSNNFVNRITKKILKKFLGQQFEHIWG
ncbi:MAG: glycosyltransferase [Desulfovibrio sp.]|nr:glycosyltransferase [Desulfovibrio sp.]